MGQTPDLSLLPVFIAVAETASMSLAARRLDMPKSSVSRSISRLEASLKVQLFHRTTRQLSLTSAGTAFYDKARPLLAALNDALGTIPEQEEEPSGTVRVTAAVDIGLTFLSDLAARFSVRYPQVSLDMRLSNRVVDLVGEGFDVGLRVGTKLADSTLVARKLSSLEFYLYASPSYLARRGSPRQIEDIGEHDWVRFTAMKAGVGMTKPKRVSVTSDELMFTREVIRAGAGIGLLPTFLVQREVAAGELVRVLPKWSMPGGSFFFVTPRSQHMPRKVIAFRNFLLEALAMRPLSAKTEA